MNKYLIIVLLFVQGLFAQEVEFVAKPTRTSIGINEKLRVEFSMNKDGDNFNPPSFDGFSASGPSQMISNSWINGQRTYTKTYSYLLSPSSKGTFTIGQATIEIDGQTYKTSPFKITVGNAVQRSNQPGNSQYGGDEISGDPNEGIHLVAEISNTSPYVNQPINVVYKLYVSQNKSVSNFWEVESPQYNDFWSQIDIVDGNSMRVEQGTYKGEPYRYVVLRKTMLYPQKSGRLELEPLVVKLLTEVPTGRRDFFGRQQTRQVETEATTGKNYINVKALPDAGRPDNFTGAVGNFDFKVLPSKTTIENGESIQLNVSVSGRGNLKLFTLPKPVVPSALEMYDPEHKEDVKTPSTGMQGSISDIYTIVPTNKGKYPVKPLSFSWFDPSAGRYKTVTSDEIMIDVLNVPNSATTANSQSPQQKQQVTSQEQFRYIATGTSLEPIGKDGFFGSGMFYALLAAPFVLLPFVILARRKKEAYDSDVEGSKTRRNNKLARKYLGEAKRQLGNKEPFYLALEKALHNFLKAKLKIETSEMSRDNIRELLLSRNATPDTVNDFTRIMDNCEFARYAPSSNTAMQKDYEDAVEVISNLQRQIR